MTEFLARVSAKRPALTIALWLLVTLIGGALSGSLLDSATTTEFRMGSAARSPSEPQSCWRTGSEALSR